MKRGLKIKLPLAFWSLSVMLALLVGCNKNAEQHTSTANVPLVIFDTDTEVEDDLVLYKYTSAWEAASTGHASARVGKLDALEKEIERLKSER